MTTTENLHYAIGELAYAVASVGGRIQHNDRQKFHDIIIAELHAHQADFDISGIVFQMMYKMKMDTETTYKWAMKDIKLNSHYLSPELKQTFIDIIERIAAAYPHNASREYNIVERFKRDIKPLIGDPIYYGYAMAD
ncbi:MAG: hypothetical protein V4608_02595 [Bacteroidota bacterium]